MTTYDKWVAYTEKACYQRAFLPQTLHVHTSLPKCHPPLRGVHACTHAREREIIPNLLLRASRRSVRNSPENLLNDIKFLVLRPRNQDVESPCIHYDLNLLRTSLISKPHNNNTRTPRMGGGASITKAQHHRAHVSCRACVHTAVMFDIAHAASFRMDRLWNVSILTRGATQPTEDRE